MLIRAARDEAADRFCDWPVTVVVGAENEKSFQLPV